MEAVEAERAWPRVHAIDGGGGAFLWSGGDRQIIRKGLREDRDWCKELVDEPLCEGLGAGEEIGVRGLLERREARPSLQVRMSNKRTVLVVS